MPNYDLSKEVSVKLSLGHLLMIREVLSNKLAGLPVNEVFTENEKRAIWALEDICDRALIDLGTTGGQPGDWEKLVEQANEYIKTVPVDFLD